MTCFMIICLQNYIPFPKPNIEAFLHCAWQEDHEASGYLSSTETEATSSQS